MEHRFVAPETLHRMLRKAHAEGVHILATAANPDRPGILGAQVSSTRPGHVPYTVLLLGDEAGCDCPGYKKFGYCKHFALVADCAGFLPDEEEPDPEPPAPASASPDPWAFPIDLAARREAAAADLARRQAASAVRSKRVRPAAA